MNNSSLGRNGMRIAGKILSALLVLVLSAAPPARAAENGNGAEPDPSKGLKITAIDFGWEGWGDGTMIESEGECMLMDTFMPDCEDTLKEFLLDNGYTEFSIYLSHFHADHFGNVRNLMWDDRFKIKAVYMPDDAYLWPTDNDYADLLGWFYSVDLGIKELAQEKGIPLIVLRPGDSFRVGDALVEILYGTTYESDDHDRAYLNNNSLVARITGGGICFLTCGDIEEVVEKRILAEGIDVSADIYKMSHHGGNTGNCYEFMEAVNPSFGFFNSTDDSPDRFAYDWVEGPVEDLLDFANVYSSRYNGDVTFHALDGVITVRAERNKKPALLLYEAQEGAGLCLTYQQFNNATKPKDTEKMKAAGAAAAANHGLIPVVIR